MDNACVGIASLIKGKSRGDIFPNTLVGKVTSAFPIIIEAGGNILTAHNLILSKSILNQKVKITNITGTLNGDNALGELLGNVTIDNALTPGSEVLLVLADNKYVVVCEI